jgi:hypothetical protein
MELQEITEWRLVAAARTLALLLLYTLLEFGYSGPVFG